MALEIIGAGFGRTGTHSLKLALEMLGVGPCHHMVECFGKPEHIAGWCEAFDAGDADWDALMAGYRSSVDWPSSYFWEQLAGHFADAKVILTVRSADSWYRSVMNTIYPSSSTREDAAASGNPQRIMAHKIVWDGVFDGEFLDRERSIAVYEEHNERVRDTIDPARLLVLEAGAGWGPLCRFLGVPVPSDPYPHSNTTESFRARMAGDSDSDGD